MVTADAVALLELVGVRFGFPRRPAFLGPIDLSIRSGECWAIVGPNGAGKSTLLRVMAGLLQPAQGHVRLRGEDLSQTKHRDRARSIAFLPQHAPADLDLSVREIVVMGRFPHRSLGIFETAEDYRIADRCMGITQVSELSDRKFFTLSGGEAQRAHVAAVLTQDPELLLLDEPTASLDLKHQLAILGLLRSRAHMGEMAVVVVTHDLNLASRFCTHVLLLNEGQCVAKGSPDGVLTPPVLRDVYGVDMEIIASAEQPQQHWLVPLQRSRGSDA